MSDLTFSSLAAARAHADAMRPGVLNENGERVYSLSSGEYAPPEYIARRRARGVYGVRVVWHYYGARAVRGRWLSVDGYR